LKNSPIFFVFCILTLVFSTLWMGGCSEVETGETKDDAKLKETGDQSKTDSQAGTPRGSDADDVLLTTWPYFEAEDATEIKAPMEVVQDADVSGGEYIVSRGGAGWIRFDIDIPEDGEYILWGSAFGKDGRSNSFHVGANTNIRPAVAWGVPHGDWQWSTVKDSWSDNERALTFKLAKGKNSIIFWNREADTSLDQIFLTTDPNASP
jgi:hypothetical protein